MTKMLGFLAEDAIVLDMESTTKDGAIRELIQRVVKSGAVAASDEEELLKRVLEREARGSTGLGEGIAIPHVKDCPTVRGLTGAFGRSEAGIPFDAIDGNPVHLIFLILGGTGTADEHVGILRKLAALRQNEHFIRFLNDAKDADAAADIIRDMAGSVA